MGQAIGGRGARPVGELVRAEIAPVLLRHGFASADIVSHWPEIAGRRIASFAEPLRLKRSRQVAGAPEAPATLVLRVDGAFALELQHSAPALIARLNGHLGWACVGKIALEQGPPRPSRPGPTARAADPAARRKAEAATDDIADPQLRAALVRLGTRALGPR